MTEQFILGYIPNRIKQLGYNQYHIRYRSLTLEDHSSLRIQAYNELFFIIDDPEGVIVESDYGVYDTTSNQVLPIYENTLQHRGEIVISNPAAGNRKIKFIQVIIVN
jgi:hypothetical protein